MNRVLKLIFGIILISFVSGGADDDFGRSMRISPGDIGAYYYRHNTGLKAIDRIGQLFDQEIKLFSGHPAYHLASSDNAGAEALLIEYDAYGLTARVEIIKRGWEIDRLLKIPLIFFIYGNNFKIEAVLKLYNGVSPEPQYVSKIEIIAGGPSVYQLFENNPHDGGLLLSHSQKIALENKAELKLARELCRDLNKTFTGPEG